MAEKCWRSDESPRCGNGCDSVKVEFGRVEGVGVKSNGMDLSICSENQENGCQSVIRGICLEDHLCIRYPLSEYSCMGEFFLELLKGVATSFVEVLRGAFQVK